MNPWYPGFQIHVQGMQSSGRMIDNSGLLNENVAAFLKLAGKHFWYVAGSQKRENTNFHVPLDWIMPNK